MIDRKKFFDAIRPDLFMGTLTQGQVQGIEAILNEWDDRELEDLRYLAYMLATTKWETNHTMLPVREAYWLSEEWRKINLRYYPYYGRGFVQLTWEQNYKTMGRLLGIDLVKYPDKAMELDIATLILFEGMLDAESGIGDFTCKALDEYFNDTVDDPVGARKIINGTDKDDEIAAIHYKFLAALKDSDVLSS
jgi:hypothetical protein